VIFLQQENADPFTYREHRAGCEGDIWIEPYDEDESDQLIDRYTLSERACPACTIEYGLWSEIIRLCGDPVYGRIAFDSFALEHHIKHRPWYARRITVAEWEYICAARSELDRIFEQRRQKQQKESEAAARKNAAAGKASIRRPRRR
jgi:hypothetical protein